MSNHGGRQLDGVSSSARALPAIAEARSARNCHCSSMAASGRASTSCGCSRSVPTSSCSAAPGPMRSPARGEAGVAHVLKLIDAEMRVAMALTGCTQHHRRSTRASSTAARIRRRSEASPLRSRNSCSTSAAVIGSANRKPWTDEQPWDAQLHQLCRFLDAFRRRFDVERMGELGDRADDRARAVAGEQVLDEAAVDLQLVEREALQIAQRRIAGAEIVERNRGRRASAANAAACSVVSPPSRKIDSVISTSRRFGARPLSASALQDGFVERAAVELHRRHVDRDANMVGPARGPVAGFADDPGADRHDEAGVLGDRHELVGETLARASGDSSGAAPRTSRCGSARGRTGAGR